MPHRILIFLCLLLFLPIASRAQESPTARFNTFLSTLSKATSLSQLRPYFSKEGWAKAYGDLPTLPSEEETELVKATADDFKGWTVKSEKIQDGKASLVVGPAKGQTTDVLMIKENGAWVIDG